MVKERFGTFLQVQVLTLLTPGLRKQLMKVGEVVETSSPSINRRPEKDRPWKQVVSPV
jgi:hypothetical protein